MVPWVKSNSPIKKILGKLMHHHQLKDPKLAYTKKFNFKAKFVKLLLILKKLQ